VLTPASGADRFIWAIGLEIEIGTRARHVDGYLKLIQTRLPQLIGT